MPLQDVGHLGEQQEQPSVSSLPTDTIEFAKRFFPLAFHLVLLNTEALYPGDEPSDTSPLAATEGCSPSSPGEASIERLMRSFYASRGVASEPGELSPRSSVPTSVLWRTLSCLHPLLFTAAARQESPNAEVSDEASPSTHPQGPTALSGEDQSAEVTEQQGVPADSGRDIAGQRCADSPDAGVSGARTEQAEARSSSSPPGPISLPTTRDFLAAMSHFVRFLPQCTSPGPSQGTGPPTLQLSLKHDGTDSVSGSSWLDLWHSST
eukprot:gene34667-44448_t